MRNEPVVIDAEFEVVEPPGSRKGAVLFTALLVGICAFWAYTAKTHAEAAAAVIVGSLQWPINVAWEALAGSRRMPQAEAEALVRRAKAQWRGGR